MTLNLMTFSFYFFNCSISASYNKRKNISKHKKSTLNFLIYSNSTYCLSVLKKNTVFQDIQCLGYLPFPKEFLKLWISGGLAKSWGEIDRFIRQLFKVKSQKSPQTVWNKSIFSSQMSNFPLTRNDNHMSLWILNSI